MKSMSLLVLITAAAAVLNPVAAQAENHLCQQQFALCTSAPCIPQPGNSKMAICSCDVEEGPNLATVACDTLKPHTDADGVRTIYSTYSPKQFQEGKRVLKCPAGTPWTWCLNAPCTVDPANPKKAVCACEIKRTGEWITAGGNCDTGTCSTGYWSGATVAAFKSGTEFMMKPLNLTKFPAQWCSPAGAQ